MNFFACCGRMDKKKDVQSSIASFTTPERDTQDFDQLSESGPSERSCGLGIAFKPSPRGTFVVKRVIPGGPAEKSGVIQVGDQLHSVDARLVNGMNKVDIASLLIGSEGSIVQLKLLRASTLQPSGSQFVDVTLERRRFEVTTPKRD